MFACCLLSSWSCQASAPETALQSGLHHGSTVQKRPADSLDELLVGI